MFDLPVTGSTARVVIGWPVSAVFPILLLTVQVTTPKTPAAAGTMQLGVSVWPSELTFDKNRSSEDCNIGQRSLRTPSTVKEPHKIDSLIRHLPFNADLDQFVNLLLDHL